MKSDKNFNMSQSTKRMLAGLSGEQRSVMKHVFIGAEIAEIKARQEQMRGKSNKSDEE